MLNTLCPSCQQKTPFKNHNDSSFWYCLFCKKQLPLSEIKTLSPNLKNKVFKKFKNASHYIKVWGNVQEGRDLIIKASLISQNANKLSERTKTHGLLLYAKNEFLGELPLERNV